MALARPLTTIFGFRLLASHGNCMRLSRISSTTAVTAFSTTAFRSATPLGPPPAGFRLPRKERWDEASESSLDKAGKYFLLTEMVRGMYVVLEQFFRPPYDNSLPEPFSSHWAPLISCQVYDILSVRERPNFASLSRRARLTKIPYRRRALHCMQALRSSLPCQCYNH